MRRLYHTAVWLTCLFCCSGLAFPGTVSAAGNTIDSLYQTMRNRKTANYQTANKLMIALDAEGVADSLYTFSPADNHSHIMKTLCRYLGYHYDAAYQYAMAARAFMDMAHYAEADNDQAEQGDALSQAAVEYHHLGQFDKAVKVNLQALHIDSLLADTALLSNDFSTLAATCIAAGWSDDAKRYILKAIELEQQRTTPTKLAIRYGHAAEIFNKRGETDKALHYAEMAYELDRKNGNEVGTARRMSQMADIYMQRKEYKQAETYYLRAIEILRNKDELHSLSIDYRQLGNLYAQQGRHREAISYMEQATQIARQTGNSFFLCMTQRNLANSYRAIGNNDKAYNSLLEAMTLYDSIHTRRMEQIMTDLHTAGCTDEAAYQMDHERSTWPWLLACLVAVVSGVGVLLYWYRSHRQQQKNSTEKKHKHAVLSAADRKFLLNVSDFVASNMKIRKITIDLIAEEMCMSRSQLSRRLTALTGESPNLFITRIRMEKAQRKLKDTDMTIKEIAYECGFEESNYFIRVFRQMYDMTPQQFRNLPSIQTPSINLRES